MKTVLLVILAILTLDNTIFARKRDKDTDDDDGENEADLDKRRPSCDCNPKPHIQTEVCDADFVIKGKILATLPPVVGNMFSNYRADFQVKVRRVYKFPSKDNVQLPKKFDKIRLTTLSDRIECSYSFHNDTIYMLTGVLQQGQFITDRCQSSVRPWHVLTPRQKRLLRIEKYHQNCKCKVRKCEKDSCRTKPNVCYIQDSDPIECQNCYTDYNHCHRFGDQCQWTNNDKFLKCQLRCHTDKCPVQTTDGQFCHFPFKYKGKKYSSCITEGRDTYQCPLTPRQPLRGICRLKDQKECEKCVVHTTKGQRCRFPFAYKNKLYDSCTTIDHSTYWCSLTAEFTGKWGECDMKEYMKCDHCVIHTTKGKRCRFPFTYKGVTYESCTRTDHHDYWCSLTAEYIGEWGMCNLEEYENCDRCVVHTTTGNKCRFPFTYKGDTYESCTTKDHDSYWCSLTSDYVGEWGKCDLVDFQKCDKCIVHTIDGRKCHFPFKYNRKTYHSCTTKDHDTYWCSLTEEYEGKWGKCDLEEHVKCDTCVIHTTEGHKCHFPFKYKRKVYEQCTEKDHDSHWCSLTPEYVGEWGKCSKREMKKCDTCIVHTTTGKKCHFPFKYEGETYKTCTDVDHSSYWCSLTAEYAGVWGNCDMREYKKCA